MSSDTVNGIPRADLQVRLLWKRNLNWWMGGQLATTKAGLAIWRKGAAPLEAPIMAADGMSSFSPMKPTVDDLVSLGMRRTPAVSKMRGPDESTPLAASKGRTSSEETWSASNCGLAAADSAAGNVLTMEGDSVPTSSGR